MIIKIIIRKLITKTTPCKTIMYPIVKTTKKKSLFQKVNANEELTKIKKRREQMSELRKEQGHEGKSRNSVLYPCKYRSR